MLMWSLRISSALFLMASFLSFGHAANRGVSTQYAKEAGDGMQLRTLRRVGVGLSAAGPLGVGGLSMELNFSAATSFILGYGGGRPFSSFTLQVKRALGGQWFVPYLAAGYAKWFNDKAAEGLANNTYPGFLGQRFLSSTAQKGGKISEDILYPSLGLQYIQLNGPWAGLSVYMEGLVLIDIADIVAAPTAGMGMIYYF